MLYIIKNELETRNLKALYEKLCPLLQELNLNFSKNSLSKGTKSRIFSRPEFASVKQAWNKLPRKKSKKETVSPTVVSTQDTFDEDEESDMAVSPRKFFKGLSGQVSTTDLVGEPQENFAYEEQLRLGLIASGMLQKPRTGIT